MSPRRGRPAKRRDATASGPVYQMDEHANVFQRRLPLEGCLSEIDWPTELRKVVREFDGLPPEPSPGRVKAKKEAERRAQERRTARIMALGALARLLLVAALGAAVVLWPYRHDCGRHLIGFMAAEAMIVLGGLWVASCTWRRRMPTTHALAMLLVLWGLALTAAEVLPRVGYAKVDPLHPPQWRCTAR